MTVGRSASVRSAILIILVAAALGVLLTWDLISEAIWSPGGHRVRGSPPAQVLLSRRDAAGDEALIAEGARVFGAQCAQCHGTQADWPMAARLKGRTRDELYALLDHLPVINPAMPGFQGTDRERRALASYLSSLEAD